MRRTTLTLLAAFATLSPLPGRAQRTEGAQDSTRRVTTPDLGTPRTIEWDTDEGTWTGLDVSPDGRTIVFDLLGDIYSIPIAGGAATRLTNGLPWDNQPRFSPDGRHIAFISDRDGMTNLWIMNADGTSPRQLSRDRKNTISSPAWMSDGPAVVVRKSIWGTGGGVELWSYHRDGGSGVRLADRARLAGPSGPSVTADSRYVFYSGGGFGGAQLFRLDRKTGSVSQLTGGGPSSFRPQVSPDGRTLAFARRQDARTELRLYDLATGRDRLLVPQVTRDASEGGGPDLLPGYAFTPDGSSIIITIAGKIARVDVATGAVRDIPYKAHQSVTLGERVKSEPRKLGGDSLVARVMRWPRISPDGKRMVFSSLARLWVMDLPNGQPRRLTTATDGEYSPAWSPDGRWIAYATWSDSSWGQVKLISGDGREQRTVTHLTRQFLNPAWSPDGSMLAVILGNPVAEQIAWQPNETLPYTVAWLRLADGELHDVIQIPVPHWPERSHPVVTFSPDGSRLYFTEQQSEPAFRRALTSIRLDGTDKVVHVRFAAGDEAVPSPDGNRVALTRGDNLWVAALPAYGVTPVDLDLDSPAIPATRLTRSGADFPAWQDAQTVVWSDAVRLLRKRVDAVGSVADATIRFDTVTSVRVTLPRAVPRGTIAFTNARIVTMRGEEVIGNGTIVVTGERIAAIGAAGSVRIPSGATVVNASGKTIIPGIIDGHAHLQFNPYGTYPQRKWPYVVNLAYGVTTAFDPWSPSHEVSEQGDMVEAGELVGPRIYSTGTWIDGRFDYLPQYVDIRNADDARGIVRRLKSLGADMLKEYVQPRRDARQYLAQAAREEHIPITAEGAGDWVHDLTMVMDGYTAFEHTLPIAPVYKDVIELMVRSEVHYTPTLIVTYGGPSLNTYFTGKMTPHDDPKVRRFTPEERMDEGRRWTWIPDDELFFREIAKSATTMSRAGVRVSLGAHGNRQGIGAHWELWGRVMGGATPWEALRDATVRPAEKLGMERDLGSLETGKLADFVVLDANPLTDIYNTAKIHWVVKGGAVYDDESMTQLWPTRKPLGGFFWQSADEARKWAAPEPPSLTGRRP